MNWWRKILQETQADTSAETQVCTSQARLDEAIAIEERVDTVTSSLSRQVERNHFSARIRESYGQTFFEPEQGYNAP